MLKHIVIQTMVLQQGLVLQIRQIKMNDIGILLSGTACDIHQQTRFPCTAYPRDNLDLWRILQAPQFSKIGWSFYDFHTDTFKTLKFLDF